MKPRIIILMHYMELGGAEMALVGLLHALDPRRVDVDLFIYAHRGPLMQFIPQWVNLLPQIPAYAAIEAPLKDALLNGHFGVAGARLWAKELHRRHLRGLGGKCDLPDASEFQYVGNCVTPLLPAISPGTEYDLCISFLSPHNIGLKKVRAKKRLAWIHTDYSKIHIDVGSELPTWQGYDYIASISEDVGREFTAVFPTLTSKVIPIENIMSNEFVRHRADEFDASVELDANRHGH